MNVGIPTAVMAHSGTCMFFFVFVSKLFL
jgi:hypothetical protein